MKSYHNTPKALYDFIEGIGEILKGDVHILGTSAEFKHDEREGSFRVYHKKGYCFDVKKEYICEPDEVGSFEDVEKDGFSYTFFCEWEGFEKITPIRAISLISYDITTENE